MPPRSASGNGNRSFGFSNGKGSAERGSGWRERMDDIPWPRSNEGFERKGNKLVKRYPALDPAADDTLPGVPANMRFGV